MPSKRVLKAHLKGLLQGFQPGPVGQDGPVGGHGEADRQPGRGAHRGVQERVNLAPRPAGKDEVESQDQDQPPDP